MYNLKKGKGSFKGLIGECMLKLTDKYLVITRFFNKQKYFTIFGRYLSHAQAEFVDKYWFSIDAIKISFENKTKTVYLYEIKTRNNYSCIKPHWRTKFTQSTIDIYTEALRIGFNVKIATVWLLDDWNYEIELEDFKKADYCIDKPKRYDLVPAHKGFELSGSIPEG